MISSEITYNWITFTLLLLVLILVILHALYKKRFNKLVNFTNFNEYVVDYIENKKSFFSFFNISLLIFVLGFFSLLSLIILNDFKLINNYSLSLFIVVAFKGLFFLSLRYFLGKVLSEVFLLQNEQRVLTYIKFTFLSKISIYIFPLIIIFIYTPYIKHLTLSLILFFLATLMVVFYIKLILKNQKIIFSNLFYFILYLCALEIIPLVYLYKAIT